MWGFLIDLILDQCLHSNRRISACPEEARETPAGERCGGFAMAELRGRSACVQPAIDLCITDRQIAA